MSKPEVVAVITVGFCVKERVPMVVNGVVGPKIKVVTLSQVFTCRSAADEFCELAQKNGHPDSFVEPEQRFSHDGYVAMSRARPKK